MNFFRVILYCLLIVFPSCGYQWGNGGLESRYQTLSVPYVEGDNEGVFTNLLIRRLTSKGPFVLAGPASELELRVCLLAPETENIGYALALTEDSARQKISVSNEGRLKLVAQVQVIDRCAQCCVLGPFKISSFIDYDFLPDLSIDHIQAFSLGQLEMNEDALEAAYTPLYRMLAEKIVDYVISSW